MVIKSIIKKPLQEKIQLKEVSSIVNIKIINIKTKDK